MQAFVSLASDNNECFIRRKWFSCRGVRTNDVGEDVSLFVIYVTGRHILRSAKNVMELIPGKIPGIYFHFLQKLNGDARHQVSACTHVSCTYV